MKGILIILVCLLALTSCLPRNNNARFEYAVACEGLKNTPLACGDLPPPYVKYFDNGPKGLLGYYNGDYTIFIRSDELSIKQESAVKFHEIVHYLQVHREGLELPGPAAEICQAEHTAFAITDVYRERLGLSPVGSNWWRPYWYCWQFYAPTGSRIIILELPDGDIIRELVE